MTVHHISGSSRVAAAQLRTAFILADCGESVSRQDAQRMAGMEITCEACKEATREDEQSIRRLTEASDGVR